MNSRIEKVEFNIYVDNEGEAELLKRAVCDFISWHGQKGNRVTARKVADAINSWQTNTFVKNKIINYFRR